MTVTGLAHQRQPHVRELRIEGAPVKVLNIDGLLKTKTDHRGKDLLDERLLLSDWVELGFYGLALLGLLLGWRWEGPGGARDGAGPVQPGLQVADGQDRPPVSGRALFPGSPCRHICRDPDRQILPCSNSS